jgi:hypothetical protein
MVCSCVFGLVFLLGTLMVTSAVVTMSSKFPHAGHVFGLLPIWLVMGALIWLCWLWFKWAQRQALYFTVDRDHLRIGYVGLRPDGSVTMPQQHVTSGRMSATIPRKNVTGVVVGSHFREWTEEWSGAVHKCEDNSLIVQYLDESGRPSTIEFSARTVSRPEWGWVANELRNALALPEN